ncbi:MAG: type II pantothenate kinase [Candidatus Korarchaeota archaeon NZ13-K]|nr:MAG: type II pantothenate kinase [Candidatus Korarchaeota archaeon NZ13-K]
MLIIGLDMGGTTSKGVLLSERGVLHRVVVVSSDPLAAAAGAIGRIVTEMGLNIGDLSSIAVSGGRSRSLPDRIFGLPLIEVDEIEAIGRGGAFLAGLEECVVVSAGTGTAVVEVRRRDSGYQVRHLGGTGVGAGTLLGLSKLILGRSSVESLLELAERGSSKNVDLTVGDIVGGPIGKLDAEATASNFGKVGDHNRPEDIAAALINMVGQVIGVVSLFAAKSVGLEDRIVLVGGLASYDLVVEAIKRPISLFGGRMISPADPQYATAIGASLKLLSSLTSLVRG